jgi:hypothetical protein
MADEAGVHQSFVIDFMKTSLSTRCRQDIDIDPLTRSISEERPYEDNHQLIDTQVLPYYSYFFSSSIIKEENTRVGERHPNEGMRKEVW